MKNAFIGAAILACATELASMMPAESASLKDPITVDRVETGDVVNWGGFSFGIQAGVTNANHELDASAHCTDCETPESFNLFNLNGLSSQGVSGRIFGQFDYDPGGDWVFGARVWYGITDAETTMSVFDGAISASMEEQDNYGGLVKIGRILGAERRTQVYGMVGYQHISYEISANAGGSSVALNEAIETSPESQGIVAGIGIEHAISKNLFLSLEGMRFWGDGDNLSKIEGLHIDKTTTIDTAHVGLRLRF